MKSIDDKVVVITGAGSGIGRALAVHCAERGARLALSDLREPELADTRRLAEAKGARVFTRALDVSDSAAQHAFAEAVQEALGPADVLINNAGVSLSETVERMRPEDFAWVMDVNFWGVVHGTSAFLGQLKSRPEAHIVNLSSLFGLIGAPTQAAYNASKFAVRGYSESLRQELSSTPVRVTCVHPGGVRTNIVRFGKHYTSETGRPIDLERQAARFDRAARTSPEDAARQIIEAVLQRSPRLLIGRDARVLDLVQRLLPAHYDKLLTLIIRLDPT
jgi:NAD(P)-dependent dehydrogenase (short-subunit alcohol dehydrogenase family)